MGVWTKGRGLLGPMKPLLGDWESLPESQETQMPMYCSRTLREFGKGWIELDARWDMGSRGTYREFAMFGAVADGLLGFRSYTNDGKQSEGHLADGADVHPEAIAFEAQMPAGLARMIYWPLEEGPGFCFAVESRNRKGWNRFLKHQYRPAGV